MGAGVTNDPRDPRVAPTLALEGLVVKGGPKLENLSPDVKRTLASGGCVTFSIWKTAAAWNIPRSRSGLPTTPGIFVTDGNVFPPPSINLIRWQIQHVMDQCRRGDYVTETFEWDQYMANPNTVETMLPPPFLFAVPFSKDAVFTPATGKPQYINLQPGTNLESNTEYVVINKGKRKGLVINLARRKAKPSKSPVNLPINSAPSKYCSVPHPLMRLDKNALPNEASEQEISTAVATFSCSVTRDTQAGYATGARCYLAAQKALGRNFASPPSSSEMVYLVTFMLGKKLQPATIRGYLSATRFYLMSQGIFTPPKLPPLAEQLIQGREKASLDSVAEAEKRTRRAISLHMLKLLENSIAQRNDWSTYEKSLRWSAILLAWWGSFRIGELLPKLSNRFNSEKDLLASDLTILDDSVACWIRAPKVPKSPQGDVVEVWKVPIRPDLDPVVALVAFLSARSEKFGSAEALPVFLHENGKIYSKNEFNLDLSTLLAVYPELDTKR